MSSPEFGSLPPEQHVKPGPPVSGPYGSTNYDPEAGTDDDNDGPPLSFADLGIPTGPQIETTVAGKMRKIQDTETKEKVFLALSGIAIIASTAFTIYKLATVDKAQADFVFALVIIVNACFCAFYLVHGVLKERPYEIFILVITTVIMLIYLIVNYSVGAEGTIKLVRLIIACCLAPFVALMGGWLGREYMLSGNLIFRTVGASSTLQSMCKNLFLFLDLLKLDLQLGITMVILILVNGINVNTLDIVVLCVGIVVTIGWFVLGHACVRFEHKIMTYVFWGLSPLELGYIIYKIVKASQRLSLAPVVAPALAACSVTAGILAALTRVGVIILTYFVYRNYDNGLKEKAFGSN
ncbi:uncharacterized protein LOC124138347 [Haliotis rufescens]|uniref:uncharacterized protein LOC124138347 n=1 Tax=Haliotis rufescens TaxID=6454 RepID=UPI00201F2C60|nr:uncharacterized protein LOC124138347 [Haliotis rufescens]